MKLKFNLKTVMNLGKSLLNVLNKTVGLVIDYSVAFAVVATFSFISLKLPELHGRYLRNKVGSKVYMIREKVGGGGGTGFAVKAPSGESYILTNDHVCEVSADKATVLVSGADGVELRRRIIAHDQHSDLCLVEGLPGVEGLTVANSAPNIGDTLNVVGHPRLMPLHLSQGEMTGIETIKIEVGPISVINPETGLEEIIPPENGGIPAEKCNLAKNKQELMTVMTWVGPLKIKLCVTETKDAYVTAVTVYPGNSGSPVVNFWGNVEGVVFASDMTNWGRMVNLADVKALLQNY